jgi:hypothetical protein
MQPQQGPDQRPGGAAGGALQAAVAAAAAAASLRLPPVQALGGAQQAGGQAPAPAPANLTQLGGPVLLPPSLPAGVGAAAPGALPPLAPVQPAGASTLALAAGQQAWQAPGPAGLVLQGSMTPAGAAGQALMGTSAAEASSIPADAAAPAAAAVAAAGASSNSSNSGSSSSSSSGGEGAPPEAAAVAEQLRQAGATLLFEKVRSGRMLLCWGAVGARQGAFGTAPHALAALPSGGPGYFGGPGCCPFDTPYIAATAAAAGAECV